MPLFNVKARDGSIELIVRAQCISCARTVAVKESKASETMLWRDPSRSQVTLIQNTQKLPYISYGRRCVLERNENDR